MTRIVLVLLVAFSLHCGNKNPIGGPINSGGTPDVNKSTAGGSGDAEKGKGPLGVGGPVNTVGTPDLNKSNGTVGGPVNTAGAPDVKKSFPDGRGAKDGGGR